MNDFEAELLELIMDTIREDKDQKETFLRRDLDTIIRRHMAAHDEEIRRETKSMLDEDEAYDEGYDDGYAVGWNDAKEEMCEALNELRISR
jgi:flagellar biosynthesis/type III secretory pathway protein FliH